MRADGEPEAGPSALGADAPDLAGLIAALHDGEVRFVVIGAVAVGAHGHIRATQDLDIVPEPRHLNLDRLGDVLVALDARLSADQRRGIGRRASPRPVCRAQPHADDEDRRSGHRAAAAGRPTVAELVAGAEQTTLGGVPLAVCSREHLIAMKQARHTLQDRADVAALLAEQ